MVISAFFILWALKRAMGENSKYVSPFKTNTSFEFASFIAFFIAPPVPKGKISSENKTFFYLYNDQ